MYRFIIHTSPKETQAISSAYLSLFKGRHHVWLQHETDYESIRLNCAYSNAYWTHYSYWQLFVASGRELVRIYYSFKESVTSNTISGQDLQTLVKCFPYTNHRDKIDRFIVQHMEHSSATTCVYCDAALVSFKPTAFQSTDGNDSYEWDHYLDKSDCPIVAMSLYNLVPVCHRCNHKKRSIIFGNSIRQTYLLSPMNRRYDFIHGVYFGIEMPKEQILKIKNIQQFKPFAIKESYISPIYQMEINVTDVVNRVYHDEGVQKEIWQFICEINSHSKKLPEKLMALWPKLYNSRMQKRYAALMNTTSRERYCKCKRDILCKYFKVNW